MRDSFELYADPVRALQMRNYLKGQFSFYGISAPQRREFIKQHAKDLVFNKDFIQLIEKLWEQDHREFKYTAIDLSQGFVSQMNTSHIPLYESMIAIDSWWDSVDGIVPQILGSLIKQDLGLRKKYCVKWIESDDFWYQRAAIILQLFYKDQTDFELLKSLILRRADSKEFFVRKASGWALRQYSKTNEDGVRNFIANNKLHPLTVREGKRLMLK